MLPPVDPLQAYYQGAATNNALRASGQMQTANPATGVPTTAQGVQAFNASPANPARTFLQAPTPERAAAGPMQTSDFLNPSLSEPQKQTLLQQLPAYNQAKQAFGMSLQNPLNPGFDPQAFAQQMQAKDALPRQLFGGGNTNGLQDVTDQMKQLTQSNNALFGQNNPYSAFARAMSPQTAQSEGPQGFNLASFLQGNGMGLGGL